MSGCSVAPEMDPPIDLWLALVLLAGSKQTLAALHVGDMMDERLSASDWPLEALQCRRPARLACRSQPLA